MFMGVSYDLTAKTEKELIEKIAIRKRDIKIGANRITGYMTVAEWSREYIDTYRNDVSYLQSKNLEIYRAYIANDAHGKTRLRDVKAIHCQKLANGLSGYSRSHATKILGFMRAMFETAIDNDLMQKNPARGVKPPSSCTDNTRRALNDIERQQVLNYADKHKHGLWIKLMIHCGLRSGETERVMVNHIDLDNARLFVDGTKSRKAQRYVPIPDILLSDLREAVKSSTSRLFVNEAGNSINKTSRRRMWNSFIRGLNIDLGAVVYRNKIIEPRFAEDITPHCLRHTYASHLEQVGVPLRVAADLLGHEKTVVTEIYTHMTEESFKDAARRINHG
jgi:integrase